MHSESSKYFRFIFENQLFEFIALPFGYNWAPFIFTKVMKVVANHLRSKGLISVFYLDDIICFGKNKQDCEFNVNQTLALLKSLRWVINLKKSQLQPSRFCQYLRFVINSIDMLLELPKEKRLKLKKLIDLFSTKSSCKIREFAKFIGCLIAACPALRYSWLYTKNFEKEKFRALIFNDNNYELRTYIPGSLKKDFDWWKTNIISGVHPILGSKYSVEIFSDASLSGWGAVCNDVEVSGFCGDSERGLHINYLELKAAFLAIKCFLKNISDCQVLLRLDNTTAISYINRMGGIQFPGLNRITKEIWQWCESKRLWLFASYVTSKDNIADKPSRIKNIDTEWEIADYAYKKLQNSWEVLILIYSRLDLTENVRYFVRVI